MKLGILALQGAVEPHQQQLSKLGIQSELIRRADGFAGIDGLILPGGESTTMLHLLKLKNMWEPLQETLGRVPAWGICAGAILLAEKVSGPEQASFGRIAIEAQRNSYGTQIDSFVDEVQLQSPLSGKMEGVFIRAPRLIPLHASVKVLGTHGEDAVVLEQGACLVSAFHPELTDNLSLLEYFVSQCS